jgi:hypothetical protein
MEESIRDRSSSSRALRLALLACTILAGGLSLFAAQASAAEGKPPVIESISAGTGSEVTAGAKINPEGLATTYEIRLECPSCVPSDQRSKGVLAAGDKGREVSLTLTGLQPGSYWFGVWASNSAGEVFQRSDILDVPPVPPGACPDGCGTVEPYKPEVSPVEIESGNEAARRHVMESEAEQRQKAKEQEEQRAKEASVRAGEEAALKRVEEEETAADAARAGAHVVPTCVVPSLKGDSLSKAQRALGKALCRLGKVSRPERLRGSLVVIGQRVGAGRRLPSGTRVGVVLG